MNENIKALLEKVTGDEGLLEKFSACGSVDEAYELAKGVVGGFTKEEFLEATKAFSTAADGDISDEDLATASGGTDDAAREGDIDLPLSITEPIKISQVKSVTIPESHIHLESNDTKASKALAI